MAKDKTHKIILIGDGAVGSSFAFSTVLQGIGHELGIIDINKKRVIGDVEDLKDALVYSSPKKIFAAEYSDCKDADIVVLCAGMAQKEGETRLDLVSKNLVIFKDMVDQVVASGFDGIFLVATNPVDILTYATWKFSGFPSSRVIGSGTALDSARFRQEIGALTNVDARSVHALIMGEHGDSEFAVWSHANIGGLPMEDWVKVHPEINEERLTEIYYDVRDKAYRIIENKGATFYGIAASLARIVKAILNNEGAILPISVYLDGEYKQKDIYIGAPAVLTSEGVRSVIELPLSDHEQNLMDKSAGQMKDVIDSAFAELENK
ncbi:MULTISPECIES: L-lactate dehydrogenase [Aerococcus]|uniref:L-lactate dehydrogenase n=1 Tax=Aerococcus sanguinicola TaxID=119206 RepID=A0A5N1GN97_9LACT|nr:MULTISPECIES: L-lactate dehydrogenase [Aerococcus]KAA9302445.1 L-lactate dehydrogenase [Aerococcus sanguinicola]MDK6369820.1 L-lactate dehydrogenase [Aerococcus sp. UMB9870]MDK6680460.1 L-lactate dehydrogenase [Aerococcus sp. UMB8608]MDK6687043.1 L-lactate dehydrogenase [Aerococcus sp. UMB8623]MDK6940262.1 L-lactate dehydrogenase [Aerococcus sp. UMB8487]